MGGRGAPNKKGLDYFPKDVTYYEDDKIFDLLEEYGPLGSTVYDVILMLVYSEGYYANLSKDKLARMVIKKIGNKWIKNKLVVVQVIDYCADIGLLCKDLLNRDIITSVGIQKRYYETAIVRMKRQLYNGEYWLLSSNGQPLLSSPITPIIIEESGINSEENAINSELNRQKEKESKTKESKAKKIYSPDGPLDDAIHSYIEYRGDIKKPMTDHAIKLLLNKLSALAGDDNAMKIKILNESIVNGWQGIFPLRDNTKGQKPKPTNRFHNFDQRETDYEALLREERRGTLDNGEK